MRLNERLVKRAPSSRPVGTAHYIIYKMKMGGPLFKKAGKVSLKVLKYKAFSLSLVVSL